MTRLAILIAFTSLSACNTAEPDPYANGMALPALTDIDQPPPARRFAPEKLEEMRKHFLSGPMYVDLVQGNHRLEVDWQLGVPGPRRDGLDLARIACRELREAQLVDSDTDVRIVNVAALAQSSGDFRNASLGHANCANGDDLGV